MCASDSVCRIAVAKKRKLLAARGMSSVRARESGLPVSIDSARASFSKSRSIKSPMRRRIRDRSVAGFRDQSTNAFSAAATARSTSRLSLSTTCEYGFPVAGSMLSRYFPPTGSTNWPSMKFRIFVSVFIDYEEDQTKKLNIEHQTSKLYSNPNHILCLQTTSYSNNASLQVWGFTTANWTASSARRRLQACQSLKPYRTRSPREITDSTKEPNRAL